jgi:predicted TIM-barrel fold metal-dependent hydrolase
MIVDVHIHLSSPELLNDRKSYLTGEPGLSVLYSDPAAPLKGTNQLIQDLDEAGVDKALVMGFSWQKEDNAKRYNDWLLKECSNYAHRLYPLASFDPRAPFALKMAEDFFKSGGFGLGELCVYDEGLSPKLLDQLQSLATICRTKSAPLLVHVNEPIGHKYPGKAPIEISQIFDLVQRCQGTKLILAHFGGGLPFLATLKKEVREYLDLTRFDTAAMPYLFEPQALALAIKILGENSFFLGTDYPLLKPARYLKYFSAAGLDETQIKALMGQSAASFLGFN